MTKKGFTLIELMVTVTIMLIMTSIIFFSYTKFNESSLLNSFAYDMSLTIRQAQIYGIAARQGSGSQSAPITRASIISGNFNSPYGVHFDSKPGDTPLSLFVGTSATTLQTFSFQRGIHIYALCVTEIGTSQNCVTQPATATLDISFLRPDPEAIISLNGNPINDASEADIVLHNTDDSVTRTVVVYATGQISVQ